MPIIISEDQNTVEFKTKNYQFITTEKMSNDACDICDLNQTEACEYAPCMPKERRDGRNGYLLLK
jgi:hypothetical protein